MKDYTPNESYASAGNETYYGTFDGAGHTITGLNITTSINPIFTIMIFFFTPIILAASPTHPARFAFKVSCKSIPT